MIVSQFNKPATIKKLKEGRWEKKGRRLVQEVRIFPSNFEMVLLSGSPGEPIKISLKDSSKPTIKKVEFEVNSKSSISSCLGFILGLIRGDAKIIFREFFRDEWRKDRDSISFIEWPGLSEMLMMEGKGGKKLFGGGDSKDIWEVYKKIWGIERKDILNSNISFSSLNKDIKRTIKDKNLRKEIDKMGEKYLKQKKYNKATKSELSSLYQ